MQDTNWIEPEKITAGHAWRRWAAKMIDSFFFLFLYVISLGTLLALGIYLLHYWAIK
ncbi:hypothetical protein ACRRVC_02370 [Candidatus Cardinium hertigii]